MSSTENLLDKKTLDQLPELLKSLRGNWPVLPSGIWNSSGIQKVLRLLHELARKSEAVGLVNILEITRAIDTAISDVHEENAQPDADEVEKLNQLLNELTLAVDAARSHSHSQSGVVSHSEVLYLHRSDASGDQITDAIEKNGWGVQCLTELEPLLLAISRQSAKVVLIDTQYLPEIDRLNKLLAELRKKKIKRPELIFLSNQCDVEIRLEVLRAGATQCFSEPVNINDLMMSIKEIVSPRLKPHYRVLVVEDDESQAKFACTLLKKGGLETLAITDPLNVMEAVQSFQPDLILMDLYMPGANGIELTQVIRGRKELSIIPIVFLSGEDDLEKKMLALYSGADDFLTKPVRPQHLVATVKTRIDRSKEMLSTVGMSLTDASTGLKNRRRLLQELDMSCIRLSLDRTFCGLFSIMLNGQESSLDDGYSADDDVVLMRVVDVVGAVISKRDCIARTGKQSLALLVKRSAAEDIEQLGADLYQQISGEIDQSTETSARWGIGLIMVESHKGAAYEYLKQAEGTALEALERGDKEYLSHQGEAPALPETQEEGASLLQEQVRTAVQSGFVQFREQRFVASQEGDPPIVEQIPAFAPTAGIPKDKGDIYQIAERFDAADSLNRLLCQHAVRKLGEAALNGNPDKVIVRLSGSAIQDEQFLTFLQSELRRLQVVGTGLIVEFDLPSLAAGLKQARQLLGELSALGVTILLGNFACNDTAFKVLAYLKADAVRPHPTLMQHDAEKIDKIASQVRSLRAQVILPRMEKFGQISLHWSEVADYVQADYIG